jgi:hypothetical protein
VKIDVMKIVRVVVVCFLLVPSIHAAQIPERLTDDAFWQMVSEFSELGGTFHSDNFVSNEIMFQRVLPKLKRGSIGGAYIGVGPEQNFTYLTAVQPQIAFIIDIRRQAMLQHLLYKAIIELSNDRADFLSLLFSRHRPGGLTAESTPGELFEAYGKALPDQAYYRRNLIKILKRLTVDHGFTISGSDRADIEYVYSAFFAHGPDIAYSTEPSVPTYAQLMLAADKNGENQSFLASEANFGIIRRLHQNNLIVPIIGDFAGRKAIRAIAVYLKEHDTLVNSFYTSNVEQYLFLQGNWAKFYRNVAELPVGPESKFIRWIPKGTRYATALKRNLNALSPISEFLSAFDNGDIRNYREVLYMTN